MRLTVHFFALFCLIAVLMKVGYPADTQPSVLETESFTDMTESNLRQASKSRAEGKLRIAEPKAGRQVPVESETRKVEPKFYPPNPKPSGKFEGTRVAEELSVRSLRLGMNQSEAQRLKPPTRIVDRLKTYWKYPPDQVDRRMGITWLEYGDHHASFNVDGVCGAVYGNGLERYGIPILAVGDSGEDVERLLGQPSQANPNHYSRGNKHTDWSYNYEGSSLAIHFTDGTVSGFTLQSDDFSDSGC